MSKIKLRNKILKIRKKKYFEIEVGNNFINNIRYKVKLSKNKIIGGYFPINFEFDCLQILRKFYFEGYTVSLPIIKKQHQMDFHKWDVNDPLTAKFTWNTTAFKVKKSVP